MTHPRQSREERHRQCCHAWLVAIEQATTILLQGRQHSNRAERASFRAIDHVLNYLEILEGMLNQVEIYWSQPPLRKPPKFRPLRNEDSVLPSPPMPQSMELMAMRRIQIRVVTSQSEVFAKKASQFRYSRPVPLWTMGANTYAKSLERIHLALELADSEYARLVLSDDEEENKRRQECLGLLTEDAEVVEVSVRFLTEERDKYRRAAMQQEARLRQKLEPQWTSRNEARARWGDERWCNNPAPKNDFAERRRQDEQQLRDIEKAIEQLDAMDVPDAVGRRYRGDRNNNSQRYNNTRPTDSSRRVSFHNYPDPTDFDWTFTGSWNNYVEFFERDEVKLDWYFTTGTVKTSLDHPTQGKTQLFGSRVTPAIYVEILQNPRAHTNVRHSRRKNRPRRNGGANTES